MINMICRRQAWPGNILLHSMRRKRHISLLLECKMLIIASIDVITTFLHLLSSKQGDDFLLFCVEYFIIDMATNWMSV